ncbi:unnamed protein product [Eruca vesicaria subsp. sativa]|uniref:Uncharacterized protein n=1 Tax=Eruca vesicaria subsp. sativa TaxID=29727 RepID=A0ABC8J5Y8_ERUVS|nr:unnamed protein product [Eruca vesicaria subsp. sativa]
MEEELKVYAPMQDISKLNSGLTKFMGIFTTFLVAGLFHELLMLYTTRVTPSGDITLLYMLHGIYTAWEMVAKLTPFGWRWAVRIAMAFMAVTIGWHYFPQI